MNRVFTHLMTFIAILLMAGTLSAQIVSKGAIIVNGGSFSDPTNNPSVQFYDAEDRSYSVFDTIQTSSVQDVLIDGLDVYVAAADSIMRYNAATGELMASALFGAPSTITMRLYNEYLLVGNWFDPFGGPSPYRNQFRIFDRMTLAYVDSVPEIFRGAKDFVVFGDTAYIAQNFQTSSFTDSAGWLVKVDLTTFSYVDSVAINQNNEDLGRLFIQDSVIYGLNGGSNTVTSYDIRTGMASTDTANANLSPSTYNSRIAIDENGLLYTVIDGKIATYDPVNRSVIDPSIVDDLILSFALDTVRDQIYITQTNFSDINGGRIYELSGVSTDTLLTGTSPEEVAVVYNYLPNAEADFDTTESEVAIKLPVLDNDSDVDARVLTLAIVTDGTQGTATVMGDSILYTPLATAIAGPDSLQYSLTDEWGDADTVWAFVEILRSSFVEEVNPVQVALFPNPATEILNVSLSTSIEGQLAILDLQGKLLIKGEIQRGLSTKMNVASLPAGLYVLQVKTASGISQIKWLKQ